MIHTPRSRHRRVDVCFALIAVLLTAGFACAETISMVALIDGRQTNPPTETPGRGCARITVDTVANTLEYYIVFSGLTGNEIAAHIHGFAEPDGEADVIHPLPAGSPKIGVYNYPEDQEADLLAGRAYINIHSVTHLGGEVRGQIVDMVADITGAQEDPAVDTLASGYGLFRIDRCTNELHYYIEANPFLLNETAAHIHGFSLHGMDSSPKHTLPSGLVKTGTWNYNEADELRILRGETYVNIHTQANPGGEIRGQIVSTLVPMHSDQVTGGGNETGHGCAFVATNRDSNMLSFFLTYQNLSNFTLSSHIHGFADPGEDGDVLFTIGTDSPASGIWDYSDAQEPEILDDRTYMDVHTGIHGGGAIRGQVIFPADPCFSDVNCNGEVDVFDLFDLLNGWGPCDPARAPCPGDLNRDGIIDVFDLFILLNNWGTCP